jgi:4'-phosphopantetheinyl transferase
MAEMLTKYSDSWTGRTAILPRSVGILASVPPGFHDEAMGNEISWPYPPPANWSLGAADVHVWAAPLNEGWATVVDSNALLSAEERLRAERFHFERHRRRFIIGRGLLRSLLGHYLSTKPGKLIFGYGPQGKPALKGNFIESGVHFNVTHSEDLALVAVTRLGDVGVDVEQVRWLADFDELVSRFFSPREAAVFRALSEEQKLGAFFNLWTRKEAWLKATGEGIAHSLNRVEVSFLPGEPARLITLPDNLEFGNKWSLCELAPAEGFTAAVAIRSTNFHLDCWRWPAPDL